MNPEQLVSRTEQPIADDVLESIRKEVGLTGIEPVQSAVDHLLIARALGKEGPIHAAADGRVDQFVKVFERAFKVARKALDKSSLNADDAVKALRTFLTVTAPLSSMLLEVVGDGGQAAVKSFERRSAEDSRAAADKFKFNVADENAVSWADKHAAELIDNISESTREAINNAIAEGLESGDVDSAYEQILEAVGSAERARLIARHETMMAASEGQRQAWAQAVDEGVLTGNEKRTWIAVGDERMCQQCEDLDGEETDLDGSYPDGIDGPPAHVQCRCTEGLTYGR